MHEIGSGGTGVVYGNWRGSTTTLCRMDEPSLGNDLSRLPIAEFAFPGPLRDRLVEAILNGHKVSTTALALAYEVENEPLPRLGQRFVVVDSSIHPVAVIEVTSVLIVPLCHVELSHAIDEGEGHTNVDDWRASHEAFWRSTEVLTALGDPTFAVDDATLVVLERFAVIERL